MKPIYLYLENFTSHHKSEIDFSGISTALIVGKSNNNELISNGVGKTSIFRAIEWVLFNQTRDAITDKDILLEDLILEGTKKCKVIFDFSIDDEIFRVIRMRTDKGVADLSFFKRSTIFDNRNVHAVDTDKDLWIDISSRRVQDTEADLIKKIRMNYKAFINTSHFLQFDFKSGLAASTPAHRKTILKEVLDLVIYSKLEKIAKNNADNILKEIEKQRNAVLILGNPENDIKILEEKITEIEDNFISTNHNYKEISIKLEALNKTREELLAQHSALEGKSSSSISKKEAILFDINQLNNSLAEYSKKRKDIITLAKQLTTEINDLNDQQAQLSKIDFSQIDIIKNTIKEITIKIATLRSQISNLQETLEELNVPLPADGTCKHCRQVLTKEHRENCQKDINDQINICKAKIKERSTNITIHLQFQKDVEKQLKELEANFTLFNDISNKIATVEKNLSEKKNIYTEYTSLIDKFSAELTSKTEQLNKINIEVQQSSASELLELQKTITLNKEIIAKTSIELNNINTIMNELNTKRAVIRHSIEEKHNNLSKKIEIETIISTLEEEFSLYPSVIQAFGSTGIPSLIINNILDDLQTETNNLLSQLRPGLQLAFEIEKINDDGTKDDTLNITYFLNNKERKYGQLSGAQKVVVMFCLKLGMSFLLKKLMGTQLNLLMIDEIDQPMDDHSVDALAEIIKHFQKDFTILLITHRKRLQDKFNMAILVEQNQDMVSTAKVVSW